MQAGPGGMQNGWRPKDALEKQIRRSTRGRCTHAAFQVCPDIGKMCNMDATEGGQDAQLWLRTTKDEGLNCHIATGLAEMAEKVDKEADRIQDHNDIQEKLAI